PDPRVPAHAISSAVEGLAPAVREALELLAANVRTVASELVPRPTRVVLPQGQVVSSRPVPVRRAGVYVPGGLAARSGRAPARDRARGLRPARGGRGVRRRRSAGGGRPCARHGADPAGRP